MAQKQKDLWQIGVRSGPCSTLGSDQHRVRVQRIPRDAEAWDMPGTEGTHEYIVHATVEAAEATIAKHLTPEAGWKQPGVSQDRFSTVCTTAELNAKLGLALKAAGFVKSADTREVNPNVAMIAAKLGVNARGKTAKATVAGKLIHLAKMAPAAKPRQQVKDSSVAQVVMDGGATRICTGFKGAGDDSVCC